MDNVKNFRDFSNGKDAQIMNNFYEALDWCIYKNYADFEMGDEGPETVFDVQDGELYCVVKGQEDERFLIERIQVMYHSYGAATILFETATDIYPVEDIANLEELTGRMKELYED